jgi:hypothetical protein
MSVRSKPKREAEAPAESERDASELPEGWAIPLLGKVATIKQGNSKLTKKIYKPDGRYVAFSGSGPDGLVDEFEFEGDALVVSAVGARYGEFSSPQDSGRRLQTQRSFAQPTPTRHRQSRNGARRARTGGVEARDLFFGSLATDLEEQESQFWI